MSERYQTEFSEATGFNIQQRHDYEELYFSDDDYTICLQARALAAARGISIIDAMKDMGEHDALRRINLFLKTYLGWKDERGLKDYLDMLTDYLDDPVPLPVKVVFLDEAQDLSKLQWKIFRNMIRGVERVYIAGDDDQSIYNFIGADPDAFNEFPADETIVLNESFRCPNSVGLWAENVISRVKNRQAKLVHWRDQDGAVLRGPRDILRLPIRRDKETLILCRHRRQVLGVSRKLMHIPHAINRDSICKSQESYMLVTHTRLRAGERVGMKDVSQLMKHFNIRWSITNGQSDYSAEELPPFPELRGKVYDHLRNYMAKGYELNVIPKLRIMTMHAAKGQQADDVIILTDCNDKAYNNQNTDHERRLMYVALTRAKERVILCAPKTEKYMRGFFE